jgi:hypothetical protein
MPESPVNTGEWTGGHIETPKPGADTNARTKTVAEMTDEEILAIFPGATIERWSE